MSQLAIKRLLRDFEEIKKEGYRENIYARPLDENIFEWHANLLPQEGRYKGILIHCILKFPENYPSEPPIITLSTPKSKKNFISLKDLIPPPT